MGINFFIVQLSFHFMHISRANRSHAIFPLCISNEQGASEISFAKNDSSFLDSDITGCFIIVPGTIREGLFNFIPRNAMTVPILANVPVSYTHLTLPTIYSV